MDTRVLLPIQSWNGLAKAIFAQFATSALAIHRARLALDGRCPLGDVIAATRRLIGEPERREARILTRGSLLQIETHHPDLCLLAVRETQAVGTGAGERGPENLAAVIIVQDGR